MLIAFVPIALSALWSPAEEPRAAEDSIGLAVARGIQPGAVRLPIGAGQEIRIELVSGADGLFEQVDATTLRARRDMILYGNDYGLALSVDGAVAHGHITLRLEPAKGVQRAVVSIDEVSPIDHPDTDAATFEKQVGEWVPIGTDEDDARDTLESRGFSVAAGDAGTSRHLIARRLAGDIRSRLTSYEWRVLLHLDGTRVDRIETFVFLHGP